MMPKTDGKGNQIAIVMCTFNGERYLQEQLDSIAEQIHSDWSLYVSDDGSTDGTLDVVRRFAEARRHKNQVFITSGPGQGSAVNFLTALAHAPSAEYYALSDQDDIWMPDKLLQALRILEGLPKGVPALYCGRTKIIDNSGRSIGCSPAFLRPASFANALVQSLAGGNTMVMNKAARDLLSAAGPDPHLVAHDWWAYQLVTGAGGIVFYDAQPRLFYRQHAGNQIGENNSLAAKFARVRLLFEGRLQAQINSNVRALSRVRHLLTPENQVYLSKFVEMRGAGFPRRLFMLRQLGLYRQTRLGYISLIFATLTGKL